MLKTKLVCLISITLLLFCQVFLFSFWKNKNKNNENKKQEKQSRVSTSRPTLKSHAFARVDKGNAQQEEAKKWSSNGGMLIQQIENEWLWKGSRWATVSGNPTLPICMPVTSNQFPSSLHNFIAFHRINLKWILENAASLWGPQQCRQMGERFSTRVDFTDS